jgi:hypothetical protein
MQASQAETNALQTRRVANHNHCHALTIQYYEVLRHYRMSTKFATRRDAVLVPFAPFKFPWQVALRFRAILERILLDPALKGCFDALVRLNVVPEVYKAPPKPIVTPPTITKRTTVEVKGVAESGVGSGITVKSGEAISANASGFITFYRSGDTIHSTSLPDGVPDLADGTFIAPGLRQVSLIFKIGGGAWKQGGSHFSATAEKEGEIVFAINDRKGQFGDNFGHGGDFWTVDLTYPSHEPDTSVPADPAKDNSAGGFRMIDDKLCSARLLKHLESNQGFYNGAVWMLMDGVERRLYLEQALADRPDILDRMDDRPIAVSGNHVAFQYSGASPQTDTPVESAEDIVTLPTRGLFAEAQMGHCNSCEKRDVTRMWDWTQMTAETPPDIGGITPGPKGVAPSIAQGQLPANVIQITQPQTAPDPTGLANALNLLKTPDIFRNMAGLAEVSKLLGEMVQAATDANTKAMALKAKEKVDELNKPTDNNNAETAPSGVSAADAADRFSLLPEIKSFAKDVGLTGDEYKQFALNQMYGTKPTGKSAGTNPKPIPQAKPDEVQIAIRVLDAWERPADADIQVTLTDDAIGPQNVLYTGVRRNAIASSANTLGLLQPIKGLTKGVIDVQVGMLSASYENMSSDVVDLHAGGIPYQFPKGTRFATFYARQAFEDVKVTVDAGETLANKVGSELSGKVTVGATIKVVEASLETQGVHNWADEYGRTQSTRKEFTIRVPKPQLSVSQTTPKLGP